MKKPPEKPAAAAADPAAVEALLADPSAAAKAPAEVAAAAIALAQAKTRPDLLWALSGHPDRAVGKAARRALHVLRSRGVAVGERPLPPPVQIGAAAPEPEPELCRASAIDGFGDRVLWLPLRVSHGLELWQVIVSDEAGVQQVQRGEISRRQLRAHFESIEREEVTLGRLSLARAAALIAEAVALGGEPRALAELQELTARLGPADPSLARPLSMGAPPPPAADEEARLSESAALFDERALASFVPAEEALRELALKIEEVDVSPLALDERQKVERRRRLLDDAIEAYFTPERRARMARRLFELVDLWAEHGQPAPAARAAAAARQLVAKGPALGNPFARRMFERLVREPAPLPEPEAAKSPGGLILPPG